MSFHVIVGAGAVGSGTARNLANAGHDVRVITRSGSGPQHPSIELVAGDAADQAFLAAQTVGVHAIYNCANPPYTDWATAWPPLAASFLAAAEANSARLVTMSNLYGYAADSSPMYATDPLDGAPSRKGAIRAQMWHDALAAHDAGRVRVTELRASDYIGPGVGETAHFGDRVVPRLLQGKSVSFLGTAFAPHSWTYIDDVCAALATLGNDDRALGRAWHVPTSAPLSAEALVAHYCDAACVKTVKVKRIPAFALRLAGLAMPVMRELHEMLYQFEAPFIIDATDTSEVFGLTATPLHEQIEATIASYQTEAAVAA